MKKLRQKFTKNRLLKILKLFLFFKLPNFNYVIFKHCVSNTGFQTFSKVWAFVNHWSFCVPEGNPSQMKEVHFQAWGHNGRCFSNANVSKPPKSAWLKIEWFFQTNVPVHSTKSSPTYRLWVSPSPQKSAREFQTFAPNWPRQDDVSFAKWKPHFSKRPLAWWETFSFLWPAKIQFKNCVCETWKLSKSALSEMQNQFFTLKTLHVKNTKSKFKLKFKVVTHSCVL